MSRSRGLVLQNALARYLTAWWPYAESAGAGRNGRDVLNTPCVWWENKTGTDGEHRPGQYMRQAVKEANGDWPVVVWWPPGSAAPEKAIAQLPLPDLMRLLEMSGVAPKKRED